MLYGYPENETIGKACCSWATFIDEFAERWKGKFSAEPSSDVVKQARRNWLKSMTGYEAFVTQTAPKPMYDR